MKAGLKKNPNPAFEFFVAISVHSNVHIFAFLGCADLSRSTLECEPSVSVIPLMFAIAFFQHISRQQM